MADSNSTTTSTDIYQIASFVDNIKAKYIDIPEDTLTMGIYGYLSEMHTNIIENSTRMASEYSNEAIPTKAKFERNIIAHALSLGINKIRALPANMNVFICIPEVNLLANMKDNQFILDKDFPIKVGKYEYHIDFDIIIERNLLPNGTYVYTAMYDINDRNEITDIVNPYLPTLGNITMTGTNLIMINTTIRQVSRNIIYKKIIVNNPLENKIINFTFDDQLAYFTVEVKEGDTIHYLNSVYDGLYDYSSNKEFCNYMYINAKTIRIKFNRDSYQPRANCEVTISVYTTKGSECNFSYTDNIVQDLTSDNYSYDNIFIVTKPISDSEFGADKKSIEDLKTAIPKEALSRGLISTYTDINNYFNSINSADCRLYFLEKVHNQIERLYYSYLLLKSEGNIVPTNTLDVEISRSMYQSINPVNYVMQPGAIMYRNSDKTVGIPMLTTEEIAAYDKSGFLYMNPFLTVVNKSPFFVSYYLNILDYVRALTFEYINSNSQLQFVATEIKCKRLFYTDRDKYKLTIEMTQNINSDFGLINTDDNGNIIECNIKVFGVVYLNGVAYRYTTATLTDYDDKEFVYTFQIEFTTNDIIDKNGRIAIEHGMKDVNTDTELTAYLPSNIDFKLFMLAKFDNEYGREKDIDKIVPGLDGWSLCNIYGILNSGIDLFYDYTNIVTSYITLKKNLDSTYDYYIRKMPLVRYTYLDTEDRVKSFIKSVDYRRIWIESCLIFLEDSFGVDFKFFNTYGPSKLYNIDNESLLNRVNMSLTFEVKFVMDQDSYILDDINTDIKAYLEDINNINDLHMPNLITVITTKYRSQLVYFKFIDLNGYGPVKQSIYKQNTDSFAESNTVPEFLNVNTLANNEPDIKYNIVS
jgi:hypothetical protein